MFGKLKEKLKGWFRKTEDLAEAEEKKTEKPEKEESAPSPPKMQDKEITCKKEETLQLPATKEEEIEKPEKGELPEKKGIFRKISSKLKFKITEEYFEQIFSGLELVLLENNVSMEVVEKIKSDLKKELIGLEIRKNQVEEEIKKALKISIESLFFRPFSLTEKIKEKAKSEEPFVIVFFGVNGSGKTTTIAKIANRLQKKNLTCILAASDTFRAASIEQLEHHASILKIKVIKSQYGADPASVAFDAIKHAKSKKIKAVLIDTAGRMHTKSDLMREMEKIVKVSKPDLKIFVAESITGNDATEQAKAFNEQIGIDGIILTKSDIDEKGGTALSVSYTTSKPIIYLGTGQNYGDIEKFDKYRLIKQLGL